LVLALVLLGCGFALWKGGTAERLGAAVILLNTFSYMAADSLIPEGMRGLLILGIDGLTALFLLGITLRYGSPWLGAVMLFYAVQFGLHSFYFVMDRPPDLLHAIINNVNFSAEILCLTIGTIASIRRRMKAARVQAAGLGA